MSDNSPFYEKSSTEIRDDLLEHFVGGFVKETNEMHRNSLTNKAYAADTPPLTYVLQCGLPDLTTGLLKSIFRVWGVKDDSFKEFSLDIDFTINTANNTIVFVSGQEPDLETEFFVTYVYDQGYSSGATAVDRGTMVDILMSAFASQMGAQYSNMLLAKLGGYIDTAVGSDLDRIIKIIDMERNLASPATGFVTVFRSSSIGSPNIALGTRFSSDAIGGLASIVYETTEAKTFIDGFTSQRLPIKASSGYEGKQSNIAPDKIVNVINPVAGIVAVTNPSNYQDYEFLDSLSGKYIYTLLNLPERVVNAGNVYPPSANDNGLFAIMNWIDKDIDVTVGNWVETDPNSEVTVTEDDPETGVTKIEVSGITGAPYIEINTLDVPRESTNPNNPGYDQVYIYLRSPDGATFDIRLEDVSAVNSTPSLYEFPVTGPTSPSTPGTDYTLFHAGHGLAGTETDNIKKVRIIFQSAGTFYIDWIGLGTFIREDSNPASAEETKLSYTSGNFNLFQSAGADDFFQIYDGDGSDGQVDQLMIYYNWKNNIGGGNNEETDVAVRIRAKISIIGLGKGTKAAIRSALLDIDSITQASIKDFDDDTTIDPGDMIVIVLTQGFRVSPTLQSVIIDTVDDNRAAGIRATILLPSIRYVNFSVDFVYDNSDGQYDSTSGQVALIAIIESVITDYFNDEIIIDNHVHWSNLISYVIDTVPVVIGGTVTEDQATTPSYVDDDFDGTYAWNSTIIKIGYISAAESGIAIAIQGGNNITVTVTKKTSL